MKTLRLIKNSLAAITVTLSLVACSDDDNNESEQPDTTITVNLADADINYDADGVWADVYDSDVSALTVGDVQFSHLAYADYAYWEGFCASKSSDTQDYTGGDWIAHQNTAITGGGLAGKGTPYIIGYWSSWASQPSNVITLKDGSKFSPKDVYVTNNTYGYYAMLNGTPYNKKFDDTDWCKLTITGYLGTAQVGEVDIYLADKGRIVDSWQKVDLTPLGQIDRIEFAMSSSDSGAYGMNNPSYFCLDRFSYTK